MVGLPHVAKQPPDCWKPAGKCREFVNSLTGAHADQGACIASGLTRTNYCSSRGTPSVADFTTANNTFGQICICVCDNATPGVFDAAGHWFGGDEPNTSATDTRVARADGWCGADGVAERESEGTRNAQRVFEAAKKIAQENEYAEAAASFAAAADQGHAQAQYRLGEYYLLGFGVEQSVVLARKWLRRASDNGDASAPNQLGYLLLMLAESSSNPQTKQNYGTMATRLYLQAAAQGARASQSTVCSFYYLGMYVPNDPQTALVWCTKAANQGVVKAQMLASQILLENYGHEGFQDANTAWLSLYWMSVAGKTGDPRATQSVPAIRDTFSFSKHDLSRTERMVAKFKGGDACQASGMTRKNFCNGRGTPVPVVETYQDTRICTCRCDGNAAVLPGARHCELPDVDWLFDSGEKQYQDGKYQASLPFFHEAADAGDARALYRLGLLYMPNKTRPDWGQSSSTSLRYLASAAKWTVGEGFASGTDENAGVGYASAQYTLAALRGDHGTVVFQIDNMSAFQLSRHAAAVGLAAAQRDYAAVWVQGP